MCFAKSKENICNLVLNNRSQTEFKICQMNVPICLSLSICYSLGLKPIHLHLEQITVFTQVSFVH